MAEIARKSGQDVVKGYEDYAKTPHGRLRHDLLFEIYARFLEKNPVRWMVDVGAGSGLLVARLLARFPSMRFVVVDDDAAMISGARERLEASGAKDRWETVTASYRDVPKILAERTSLGPSCLVSFNHVIEYVEDQEGALRGLAAALGPGARLGVMYLNNSHEALRRVWHKDSIDGFLRQLESGDFDAVNFGMARAVLTDRLHAALASGGLQLLEERGMRCFAEWKTKEFIDARYAEVLAAEEKVSGHPDFIGLARYRVRFYGRSSS
jgi:ubiquinone/menaquinone biosynthesis C-methylase UbiE